MQILGMVHTKIDVVNLKAGKEMESKDKGSNGQSKRQI